MLSPNPISWTHDSQEIEYYSFSPQGWVRHYLYCYPWQLPKAILDAHPPKTQFNRRVRVYADSTTHEVTLHGNQFISTLSVFNK